jgi:acylphosphatase
MSTVRYRLLISGRVQGVFFRDSLRRQADERGVAGWVRNLSDGRVEAILEGPPDRVEALVEWARHGPPQASVEQVSVQAEPPEGITGFAVR